MDRTSSAIRPARRSHPPAWRALAAWLLAGTLASTAWAADTTRAIAGRRGLFDGTITSVGVAAHGKTFADGSRAELGLSWSHARWLGTTSFPASLGDEVPIAGVAYEVTRITEPGPQPREPRRGGMLSEPDTGRIDVRARGPVCAGATRDSFVIALHAGDERRPLVFLSQHDGWDVRLFFNAIRHEEGEAPYADVSIQTGPYDSSVDLYRENPNGTRRAAALRKGVTITLAHVGQLRVVDVLEPTAQRPGWLVLDPVTP